MSVLLALGSAITFGIADFLGGLAARRTAAWSVVIGSQFFGGLLLVVLLPVLPPATIETRDLLWGAAAGVAGAVGLTQFFRALALGAMSVVAPVSAVVSGAVPVMAGVGFGERPSALAWAGIVLALPAIACIAREHVDVVERVRADVLVSAVAGGFGFGMFFVLIDRTASTAGIQPLISARTTSVLLLGILGLVTGRLEAVRGRLLGMIALSGVLDMGANVLFLYSVREGLLALGSVISAMYPASTLVLARTVLGERLQRIQVVGLGMAGVAVGLVALG
ncbi:EamA family transporter [Actinospongicola halichondriae]|uniref:EamA family transporter n=1 Tax=Actinospongicola halichondriae TaxID=3236844 RepID=UPI003D4B33A2